jgi:hypothetical protein
MGVAVCELLAVAVAYGYAFSWFRPAIGSRS